MQQEVKWKGSKSQLLENTSLASWDLDQGNSWVSEAY
jgi:hypothetical protein